MQISTFALYGIVEAIVFLVVICFFLLIYIRRNKTKIHGLQLNLQKLLVTYKRLQHQLEQERIDHSTANTYKKQINDQLLATRHYHKGLNAGQDIALDLNPESPKERQTAAIRHAMLVAEKEALNSSSDGTPNWSYLETKFQQLIQFYVDLSVKKTKLPETTEPVLPNQDEDLARQLKETEQSLAEKVEELETLAKDIETAQKRVGNLEKFKKLFFDMEKKWEEAKAEAEVYYQRLQGLRSQVDDSEGYDNLINDYHNVYSEFELTLQDFSEQDEDTAAEEEFMAPMPKDTAAINNGPNSSETIEIMNSEKQALEELKKLRNLTADQHRLITRLQNQLDDAKTIEEKEALITELEIELKKQIGYVQEFEACIQLMENELSNAMTRLKALEEDYSSAQAELEHVPQMQKTIQQFAHESKEMLTALNDLERLNESLQTSQSGKAARDSEEQSELTTKLHEELQALQGQYAELEERYLEAKMQD